jgi:hypothetical protein
MHRRGFKETLSEETTVSELKKVDGEESGSFELIDCGQASRVTRGIPLVILFELGTPPWNKLFLF